LAQERSKTIEGLKEALAAANGMVSERDNTIASLQATIEAQKKQLAEKEAEIKELAGKPAPMTDAAAGVPANNGTGDAPKYKGVKSVITEGMSLEEKKAAIRAKDESRKTYRH
jgi:chromosome segregation ATPase